MGAQQHVKLTRPMVARLQFVRDFGPSAWDHGAGRAGGAISRMFGRMHAAGLVSKPPYIVTMKGLQALADWEAKHGKIQDHR